MPISTSTTPAQYITDGAYVNQVPTPPPSPVGPNTGLIAIGGFANWGPTNSPNYYTSVASGISIYGNATYVPNSLILATMAASPECASFIGVRFTNGGDTAATIAMLGTDNNTLVTLTAKYSGSLPNPATGTAASAQISFQSGSLSGGTTPVFVMSIAFPGYASETFTALVGGSNTYVASTFIASVVAAVNGQVANKTGSIRWTATAGTGTAPPVLTKTYATGGTDGAPVSGITGSTLVTSGPYSGYPILGTNATIPGTGTALYGYRIHRQR